MCVSKSRQKIRALRSRRATFEAIAAVVEPEHRDAQSLSQAVSAGIEALVDKHLVYQRLHAGAIRYADERRTIRDAA